MSASTNKTDQNTETTNEDNRVIADNGAIVVNGAQRVEMIDAGAIELAENVTREALLTASGVADIGSSFGLEALGFVQANQADTNRIVEQVLYQSQSDATQLYETAIKFVLPSAAIAFAIWRLNK